MATIETQQLDDIIVSGRRKMLTLGGAALAGLVFAGVKSAEAQATTSYTDADILNFALNLEYLEAQFYTLATQARPSTRLAWASARARPQPVAAALSPSRVDPASCLVPWTRPAIQAYATETATEERNHVLFLRGALAGAAVAQPNLNLSTAFDALASAAKIGPSFDPFASDVNFLVGAFIFEDVGVTAYSGAAPLITTPAYLAAAAGILSVEAYHAGLIRTAIFLNDSTGANGVQALTQKIAATRMALDGSTTVDDIGVGFQTTSTEPSGTTLQAATIVDAQTATPNFSRTYSRTTSQVLRIVTGSTAAPPTGTKYSGVFFPNGLNGLFS